MGIRRGGRVAVGTQQAFACNLPAGFLECDGGLYNGAVYPALYLAIGTRYNIGGEAAGFFRVPDKRGRGSISRGQGSGLTNRTQGQKVGAETVALSEAQLAVHTHTQGGHAHFVDIDGDATDTNSTAATHISGTLAAGTAGSRRAATTTESGAGANSNTGSGATHNNMSPVEVDIWGIKY